MIGNNNNNILNSNSNGSNNTVKVRNNFGMPKLDTKIKELKIET